LFGDSKRRSRRNRRRARVRGRADQPTADRVARRPPVPSRRVLPHRVRRPVVCPVARPVRQSRRHPRQRLRKQRHRPRRGQSQGQCPSRVPARYRSRRVRSPVQVAAAVSVLRDPRRPRPPQSLRRQWSPRRHQPRRSPRSHRQLRPSRRPPRLLVPRRRVRPASVPVSRVKASPVKVSPVKASPVKASPVSKVSRVKVSPVKDSPVKVSRDSRARASSVRAPAPVVRVLADPVSGVRPARRVRAPATTRSVRPRPVWARLRRPRLALVPRVRRHQAASVSLAVRAPASPELPAPVPLVPAAVVLAAPEHPARPRVTAVPVLVVRAQAVRVRAR